MQDGTTNWSTVSNEMESVSMAERGSLGQGTRVNRLAMVVPSQ